MRWKDQVAFVKQNMKKNKTRMFMTILATAMGCAFLIVLASVGFGLNESIVKETTENRTVTNIEVHNKTEGDSEGLTDKDVQYFESIDHVKAVTRRQALQQPGEYTLDAFKITAGTVVANMSSEVKAGFELSKGRLPEKDNEVVVGYHFLENLLPEGVDYDKIYDEKGQLKEEYLYKGDLIGKTIELTVHLSDNKSDDKTKKIKLEIVGLGKKPTKDWIYNSNVYISENILKSIEGFTGTAKGALRSSEENNNQLSDARVYDEVNIYADKLENVESISKQLEDKNYYVYSVLNELQEINKVFAILKVGLIFIGTIAIIIASIGIYNTMTMSVTERAPDIGIMKALGANPAVIKKIFLLESSFIGLIGALVGTVVSYGISYLVNFIIPIVVKSFFNEEIPSGFMFSSIPFSLPIICIIICYAVTIISGSRPARRATKVDVLKALRREV
ncbi:ABC transporter permease [Niallia sp. 01092]|uniref:ABC transporter permease n=1 Tax=unclassified Niallia TaxID=2837522 RepID=UPI003FD2D696